MPRDAFVLKIQRELCHPKCARKVSGLSRNGPLDIQLQDKNERPFNYSHLFLMSLGICFPSLVDADGSSAGGGGVWGPDDDDETCGVEGGVVLGVEVRSGCEPCASTWETRQLLLLERFLDSVFSSLVLSLPGHAHTRIFKAFRPKTWLLKRQKSDE